MGNGGIYGACEFLNIPSIACIWAIPTCRTIPGWLGLIDPLRFRQCRTSARQATSFRHRDILVFYSGRSLRLLRCFFPSSLSSRKPNVLLKDIATMIKGALQWCSMPSYYLSCMCIYLHIYIYDWNMCMVSRWCQVLRTLVQEESLERPVFARYCCRYMPMTSVHWQ